MDRKAEEITECTLNPEKFFKSPEAVLSDKSLTQEQKDKILHCWEEEEVALMRAEEENMSLKTDTPLPVDVLEQIKDAEKKLEHTGKGEKCS